MFLCYNNSHKGYKCLNSQGRIFISRHVFNEEAFPFHDGFLNIKGPLKTLTESPLVSLPMYTECTIIFLNDNNLDEELGPINNHTETIVDTDDIDTTQRISYYK